MFTRRAKKDDNHNEIKISIESCGLSVLDIHQLKKCADMIVGAGKWCVVVEIKNGNKKLSDGEDNFRKRWRGPWFLVNSFHDFVKQWYKLTGEQLIVF